MLKKYAGMRASCCRQNDCTKDVRALIPETCDYVMLYDERDFAYVIKVTGLQIGR